MQLHVQIDFGYSFDDQNLNGFARLIDLVKSLQAIGVETRVNALGEHPRASALAQAPPSVPVTRRTTAGRPPANKPTEPMVAPMSAKPPPAPAPTEDLLGEDLETDPLDAEMSGEGVGLSPAEARDQGLAHARAIYNAGHKREIKVLQETFGVARFADVPVTRGHDFFKAVTTLSEKLGLGA